MRIPPVVNILLKAVIVVLIVFLGFSYGPRLWAKWFPEKKQEVFIPTATAKVGDLVISVKEIGNIEAERSIPVSSEIDGKIIVLAAEGKTVSPGELLIQIDDTPLKEQVRNSTLEYNNAKANVLKAKSELEIQKESNKTDVEQQEAQLNFDKTELERAEANYAKKKRLADEKLIPGPEVESAEIEVRSKKFAIQKSEKALVLKRKEVESRDAQKMADVQNVEFSAIMARSRLDEATRRLSKARINAPAGGLVVISKTWMGDGRRKFKEGDSVYPNQQILQLPDLSSMLVKINVDEADIARVRVGQTVKMTVDALPGKAFSGKVKEISNLATEASPWESSNNTPGRKNFEVTVKVESKNSNLLRPGMTANTEIISDRVANTVLVPIEAIFEKAKKRFAYVRSGGKYTAREVEVGKRNETMVAVKKGLNRGAVIALKDPTRGAAEKEKPKQKAKPVPTPASAAVTGK